MKCPNCGSFDLKTDDEIVDMTRCLSCGVVKADIYFLEYHSCKEGE